MKNNIYRITISIEEFETEGFWSLINLCELGKNKAQIIESLTKFYNDSKNYIEKRINDEMD